MSQQLKVLVAAIKQFPPAPAVKAALIDYLIDEREEMGDIISALQADASIVPLKPPTLEEHAEVMSTHVDLTEPPLLPVWVDDMHDHQKLLTPNYTGAFLRFILAVCGRAPRADLLNTLSQYNDVVDGYDPKTIPQCRVVRVDTDGFYSGGDGPDAWLIIAGEARVMVYLAGPRPCIRFIRQWVKNYDAVTSQYIGTEYIDESNVDVANVPITDLTQEQLLKSLKFALGLDYILPCVNMQDWATLVCARETKLSDSLSVLASVCNELMSLMPVAQTTLNGISVKLVGSTFDLLFVRNRLHLEFHVDNKTQSVDFKASGNATINAWIRENRHGNYNDLTYSEFKHLLSLHYLYAPKAA